MKLNPIIHLSHAQNCSDFQLRGWETSDNGKVWDEIFHLAPDEMRPLVGPDWKRCIFDLSRIIIAEPTQLMILSPGARGVPVVDAQFETRSWVIHMDVNQFFRTVLMLREKKINTDLNLNSFRKPALAVPQLNLAQLVHHKNACEITGTVAHWMRTFDPQWRGRLQRWLNQQLPRTQIIGYDHRKEKDELYFTGRQKDGSPGMGYNGAAILRDEGFSTHT